MRIITKVFLKRTIIAGLAVFVLAGALSGCASSSGKKKKSKIDICPSWGGDGM